MSIPLALLLAAQPAVPAAGRPIAEPIVVTANRLDAVRFNLSINRLTGQMKCTVARSSGRPEIDAYMCDVARFCAQTHRNKRVAIEQCITDRKSVYLHDRQAERGR